MSEVAWCPGCDDLGEKLERATKVCEALDNELSERRGVEHLLLCEFLDAIYEVHERFLSRMLNDGAA